MPNITKYHSLALTLTNQFRVAEITMLDMLMADLEANRIPIDYIAVRDRKKVINKDMAGGDSLCINFANLIQPIKGLEHNGLKEARVDIDLRDPDLEDTWYTQFIDVTYCSKMGPHIFRDLFWDDVEKTHRRIWKVVSRHRKEGDNARYTSIEEFAKDYKIRAAEYLALIPKHAKVRAKLEEQAKVRNQQ